MEIVNAFPVAALATAVCIAPFSQAAESGAQGEAVNGQGGLAKKLTAPAERRTQSLPEGAAKPREVLAPGTAVVLANRVNVRGQARLKSEVVGHLTHGEPVTVLQVIPLEHAGPEEPSAWAKIALPTRIHPWVSAHFVDPGNKTVNATKLNLRGGPGQNYSVLGLLRQGASVKDLSTRGDWLEIETPTNAYAFVAAQYLKPVAPATLNAGALRTSEPKLATSSATVSSPTTTPPETNAADSAPEAATTSAAVTSPTSVTPPPETATATNPASATPTAVAPAPATPPETNAPATMVAGETQVEQPPAPTPEPTKAAAKAEVSKSAMAEKVEPKAKIKQAAKAAAKADANSEPPARGATMDSETAALFQPPPLPISADKQVRLKDLTERYKADQITPAEYHAQRARILAEP
jgi:uncharacterized protein YgiM (DUF1202 family)